MLRRSRSNVVNLLNGGTIKALPRHPIFMKARGCGKRLLVIPPITFNPLKYDFLVLLSGLYNKSESLKKSNVCCCVWERVDISLIHVFLGGFLPCVNYKSKDCQRSIWFTPRRCNRCVKKVLFLGVLYKEQRKPFIKRFKCWSELKIYSTRQDIFVISLHNHWFWKYAAVLN